MHNGRLLGLAREQLEALHEENLREQSRRRDEIYLRIPAIQSIDGQMRRQMTQLLRISVSGAPDMKDRLDALRDENLGLQMQKAELLHSHGYPMTYLDDIYACPLCKDTGNVDGKVCDCLERLYNAELTKELSTLTRSGDERFERFDLNLYENTRDASGQVPRAIMTNVYKACRRFAENFPNVSSNLLLQGGTGLGKTYLSACIARAVAEKGLSVCYDSATAALDAFEAQRFARDADTAESARQKVRRMLDCDLMILDDLGTEMVTQLSTSALYTLINTRLSAGKPMVISTNCSDEELQRRYTPQIFSRLDGCFLKLPFVGQDLRRKKN